MKWKTFGLKLTLWTLLIYAFLTMPATAAENKKGDLTWTGCGITRKAFMAECADAYQKQKGITITLSGGGATRGIRAAASGLADLGGSCRPAKPDLSDEEKGVKMTQVAWDALVIIVHPDNPINNLTTDQVSTIFKGKIRNWKDVGGKISQIKVVVRPGKISGVGYMARTLLFNDPNFNFYPRAISMKSSGPVEKAIEKTKNAIAITGVSSARKRKVKIIRLNGLDPTKANIISTKYPYFRPLYLMARGEPIGEIRVFLDWILSQIGQKVISEQGTVNMEEGKDLFSKFKYWEHTESIRNYPK